MTGTAKTNSLVQKSCPIAIVATFFIIVFAMHVGVASKANAQEIDMTTYCHHFHNWASSGTTGVNSTLCKHLDEIGHYPVYQDEFCFHDHKFALNLTSEPVGSAGVVDWCNDDNKHASPITWEILDFHYHNNAGTGTTGPVQ